jgi:four helix bundle protein
MTGFGDFTDLEVYKLAERLGDFIWDIVLAWPHLAQNTLGTQIIRAADSIGANIAEGHGSESSAENRRFVRFGRRSLNETRHWLRRCQKRKLLTSQQEATIHEILQKLRPMLGSYLNSISRKVIAKK